MGAPLVLQKWNEMKNEKKTVGRGSPPPAPITATKCNPISKYSHPDDISFSICNLCVNYDYKKSILGPKPAREAGKARCQNPATSKLPLIGAF